MTRLNKTALRFCALPIVGAALSAFALGSPAFADATLVYDNQGSQVTLEARGDDLRMNSPELDGGYVLYLGGRTYAVSQLNGQALVLDVEAVAQELSNMPFLSGTVPSADEADDTLSLKSVERTGRRETIAGIEGEVVVLVDSEGARKEAVIADDADVRDAFLTMVSMAQGIAEGLSGAPGMDGFGEMGFAEDLRGLEGGVLRLENDFVLQSVERASPDAARFVLPAEPVTSFMQMMTMMAR